jgi:type I restriction enzyme M protein
MNTDTKRHIDSARQVLVGVVPNPTSQIDQITNALIYKFMDDMDQSAIKQGDEPSFFVDDLENYAWTRLMDPRMGNQERMNLYGEALIKFSQAKQLPELFRGIFKSAFLPYRSPETLGLFLKEIDYFDYSHPEELGNAYEYLLSIMSSQGDAGQFRTPRHIIDFIVDVVNPTKDDKVLDPACGTGGFLVSSYKHILAQHDGKDDPKKKEKPLTPDERKKLMANFEGYDIDPTMVRIAQVNMYLHQFKNPKIFQYDSLSSEERWNDKFDVILANPPFMSPKGGIKPHSKFSIPSSRSEVLFVDYIMNHLRPKGRAGIIVPEGIIFQSGTAHKQLRKNLVEDGLYAVVSLPSGVFAPYSGVKTSILLFNNELAKQSQEILFVKIEQDGYDLGATKRPISKNDLPTALDILNKWNTGEKIENKLAVYVEKSKIAENGDYNLSGDRYRVATDYTNAKWPMVKLGEICEFIGKGGRPASFATENGKIPFVVSSSFEKKCDTADFDTEALIIGDGGSANIHYINGRFSASDHTYVLKNKNEEAVSLMYVYILILNNLEIIEKGFQGQGLKNVSKKHLQSIQIPLPPLEIQEQIVAELDGYAGIIDGAKQIAQNWKPKIDIDPEWEKMKLDKIVSFSQGVQVDLEDQLKTPTKDYEKFLRIENYTQNSDDFRYIPKKMGREKFVTKDDVVVVRYGASAGFIGRGLDGILANNLFLVTPEIKELDKSYLYHYLNSDLAQTYLKQAMAGGAMPALSFGIVKELEIVIPPLAIQKQIVEKIEAERTLVESAKKLIDIYDQKTKESIAKLWSE